MRSAEMMLQDVAELPMPAIHEAELILPNMRGACVTVGGTVHTLFRLTNRPRTQPQPCGEALS